MSEERKTGFYWARFTNQKELVVVEYHAEYRDFSLFGRLDNYRVHQFDWIADKPIPVPKDIKPITDAEIIEYYNKVAEEDFPKEETCKWVNDGHNFKDDLKYPLYTPECDEFKKLPVSDSGERILSICKDWTDIKCKFCGKPIEVVG